MQLLNTFLIFHNHSAIYFLGQTAYYFPKTFISDLTLNSKSIKNIRKTSIDFTFDFEGSLGPFLGNYK